MKKVERLSVLLACLMILNLILVSCGGGKSALVGKWYLIEGSTLGNPEEMELLKDGTAIVDGLGGITWKIENQRFYLSHPLAAFSSDYKLSGAMLILEDDDGDNLIYMKPGGSSVKLAEGKWVNGSITSSNMAVAYSFNAISEKTYFIWTNDDDDGDGSKSLAIVFTIFDENDVYDSTVYSCWTDPYELTLFNNSRVTIVVRAYDEDEIGTFAIAYSTNSTRP